MKTGLFREFIIIPVGLSLLVILSVLGYSLKAQTSLGYLMINESSGITKLRIVSVADALTSGNGVVKIKMADGAIGAADLVSIDHPDASAVRVQTPYGTKSWRKESLFGYVYYGALADGGTSLAKTSDGGFAIGGSSNSWGAGLMDHLLIKTDADGVNTWTGVYGTAYDNYGNDLIQRSDGGYVQVGVIFISSSYYIYLSLVNPDGSLQSNGYWLPPAGNTQAYEVIQCADGNFLTAGYIYGYGNGSNDVYIVKFNSSGATLWANALGTTNSESAYGVVQRPDGGYIVVGEGYSGTNREALYYAMGPDGLFQNGYLIGGTGVESAQSVVRSSDDKYVFAGYTTSFGAGGYDIYFRKQDGSSGVWSYALGGTADDLGMEVINTIDGGFAITGYTKTWGNGNADIWLVKTDSEGDVEWSWVFGSAATDYANGVVQKSDGSFYVAGTTYAFNSTYGDVIFVEFSPDGAACSGYAVGFDNDMNPITEGNGFKASKIDGLSKTNAPLDQIIQDAEAFQSNDRYIPASSDSRLLVTPTPIIICN